MTTQDNKAIARRYFEEFFNQGNLAAAAEIIAPEYEKAGPSAVPGLPPGPEGSNIFVMVYRTAFPDITFTVDEQVAEGDTVVTRWTATGTHQGELAGIPATGNSVTVTGVSIDRVVDGKLVGGWNISDQLGLLRQLGVIPS